MHYTPQQLAQQITSIAAQDGSHWTAYVTAFTVPVVALFAAYIAYRQWRTSQSKLKFDLFEKRMLVYQAARDMLGFVASHGKTTHDEQIKYLSGIQPARWLFGPEIAAYLDELWEKIVDLELHQTMVYDAPHDDQERQKHVLLKADTLKWLMKQYSVLDEKCAAYLSLGH